MPQKIEPTPGQHIRDALQEAKNRAVASNRECMFEFNGEDIVVKPDDNVDELLSNFERRVAEQVEAFRDSAEGRRQREALEENKRLIAEEERKPLATFSLRDPAAWQESVANNPDGYGAAVIRYAARWANLMEAALAAGRTLEDVAQETSHKADVEGISGFQYGCAVEILSKVWTHGEALRRWSNVDIQIGNEGEEANESGGCLNPALLRIEGDAK